MKFGACDGVGVTLADGGLTLVSVSDEDVLLKAG